jgi:hypothetical protein
MMTAEHENTWRTLYREARNVVRQLDTASKPTFTGARALFTVGVAGIFLGENDRSIYIQQAHGIFEMLQDNPEQAGEALSRIIIMRSLTSWLIGQRISKIELYHAADRAIDQLVAGTTSPASLTRLLMRCYTEMGDVERLSHAQRDLGEVWTRLANTMEGRLFTQALDNLRQSLRLTDAWCEQAHAAIDLSIGWTQPDSIELEGIVQYCRIIAGAIGDKRPAQVIVRTLGRL